MVTETTNCDYLATGVNQNGEEDVNHFHTKKKMYPVLNNRDLRERFD